MATTTNYGITKPTVGGDTGLWGGYWNSNADLLDAELARPRIPHNSPTVGATTTCDLSLARAFKFTVSQATTLAITNAPANTWRVAIELLITNGAAFVLTWPGSVTWLHGAAPVLKASGVDRIVLVSYDGGTTWYGNGSQPCCRVYNSAAVAEPGGAGVYTTMTFDSESLDNGGLHSTVSNTSRITIVMPGIYRIFGSITWAASATGWRSTAIFKNGGGTAEVDSRADGDAGTTTTLPAETIVQCVAGDYFELKGAQTSGGSLNMNGGAIASYFGALRIN